MKKDLSRVPLSDLIIRSEAGVEIPLSTILPVSVEYKPHDTIQSALERAIIPWKLVELGDSE